MYRFSNPLIWLLRFRHRCGYGVHSPFAFRFITEVIYEKAAYYAYRELDRTLPFRDRFRVRKILHLLFRISNWSQPDVIACFSSSDDVPKYLAAGCRKAQIVDYVPDERIDLCWLDKPNNDVLSHLHEHSVLMTDHLSKNREWFQNIPAIVTFDLYDIGIAFFDTKYNKQHYIVNF